MLNVYLLLSFYWVVQVIKNVVHVTVAGTVATWYFYEDIPHNPTLKSFKRATTYSFGSICLGSLIVAALQTLRTLFRMFARKNAGSGNWVMAILALVAASCIACIERLIRYFNKYAFTQVAIYGKTYCQAARTTFDLIWSHGIEAIINDSLISSVLTVGCIIGGVLGAGVGAGLGWIFWSDLADNYYWITMAVLGFFIGFCFVLVAMECVDSGVACLFVCYAMDPQALQRVEPDLFQKFNDSYQVL